MTEELKVNTAELHYQLQQADDTLHKLQDSAKAVGHITESFGTSLKGEAGDAVREALSGFSQAMTSLCLEHQGITEKLQAAIAAYEGADGNAAEGLTHAMKL